MSRGINKAVIVGTLGRDPEIRYAANGNARPLANLALAADGDRQGGAPSLVSDNQSANLAIDDQPNHIVCRCNKRPCCQGCIHFKLIEHQWNKGSKE